MFLLFSILWLARTLAAPENDAQKWDFKPLGTVERELGHAKKANGKWCSVPAVVTSLSSASYFG